MKPQPNVVLGIVAAVVVAMAVVATVVSLQRNPPVLDPHTPEGTVQIFVRAVVTGDDEAAVVLLDPDLGCTAPLRDIYRPDRASLAVTSSVVNGDEATVTLEVTERNGVFDSWSHREVFDLERTGSGWLITDNPWPVYNCE